MVKNTLYTRSAGLAIAASLALCSTPLLAQDAAPVAVPPVTSEPAPAATDAPAAAADTAPAAEVTETTAAPVAKAKPKAAPAKASTVKRASTASAPVAAKAAAPAAASVPAAPAQAIDATPATPIAETASPVAAPAPEPTAKPMMSEGSAELAFGGALALLALGGGALAISRRRRPAEEIYADEAYEPETVGEAPVVSEAHPAGPAFAAASAAPALGSANANSAFNWGKEAPAAAPAMRSVDDEGLSPIERARRGPTPDNPSLSLKKRLKRATFFEQRQRQIASGLAKPVDADAGLPDRVETAVQPSFATARPVYRPTYQPA